MTTGTYLTWELLGRRLIKKFNLQRVPVQKYRDFNRCFVDMNKRHKICVKLPWIVGRDLSHELFIGDTFVQCSRRPSPPRVRKTIGFATEEEAWKDVVCRIMARDNSTVYVEGDDISPRIKDDLDKTRTGMRMNKWLPKVVVTSIEELQLLSVIHNFKWLMRKPSKKDFHDSSDESEYVSGENAANALLSAQKMVWSD